MDKELKKRFKRIESIIKDLETRLKELEALQVACSEPYHVPSIKVDAQQIWREITTDYANYVDDDEGEEYNQYRGYL